MSVHELMQHNIVTVSVELTIAECCIKLTSNAPLYGSVKLCLDMID